jgi:hypothetical protein
MLTDRLESRAIPIFRHVLSYSCHLIGYALGYGLPYCEAFTADRSEFTPRGQVWVNATKLCLMQALYNASLEFTNETTCNDIKVSVSGLYATPCVQTMCCLGRIPFIHP